MDDKLLLDTFIKQVIEQGNYTELDRNYLYNRILNLVGEGVEKLTTTKNKVIGMPSFDNPKFRKLKTPIKKVKRIEMEANKTINFFFLPVRSIQTPNSGEKITKKKLAMAFA